MPSVIFLLDRLQVSEPEQGLGRAVFIHIEILILTMVLIDRASRDDSNGGYIVGFDNFDLQFEIRALEPYLAGLVTF